ncbi:zincin-like metallopeptidase toxin domain-containing protein [Flavobacterium sp. SUN052]|uniref:zincin-like metallopeptidase toxin domain-containing protein n=1 Tax=Flavobacterium sp. SUN052 TaxID=3002441 RepID=UPI00237D8E04|nr:zincin-like metallopeptidase toxin domain-containing protein [Flavobacterium sp. SUN052]MEC4004907.1 zincin-like metallopeptidase toxin domain-containing protein [Flavobacterium sp. SUN052]
MSAGTISYYLAKGIVKYHKQVQQQLKNEPQLSKQIDELVVESEKVVQVDYLANVSGRGRRLGQRLSKSNFNDLINFLKNQGCDFEIFPSTGSHKIKDFIDSDGKALIFTEGKQAAFVYTRTKMKFIVREEATVFETLHEFMHFKHAKEIGLAKYHSLGGANTAGELLKEQRVFEKMIEYNEFLTRKELEHSLDYLNDWIYNPRGINPIEFSFDINKIPEVRKEIDIKSIFNLK